MQELDEVKDYLEDFEDKLKNLKTHKKNSSYFCEKLSGRKNLDSGKRTQEDLKARLLQMIFDRTKATCPFNLNEIYSYVKKYRQTQEQNTKIEEAIKESLLPDHLKTPRNYKEDAVFKDKSFLHLVCRYYKMRQKARDGRIFIQPEYRHVPERGYENTGHFWDKGHLLTYCNHKSRQKRYQVFEDVASLFQVSLDKLD